MDSVQGRAGGRKRGSTSRYNVQFPPPDGELEQDEAYFYLLEEGRGRSRLRFHDYDRIYARPGLYEQLFYERLKCQSPQKVADILRTALRQSEALTSRLRVLELGAGNGMVGSALKSFGVSRLVGVDILPEAKEAAIRDRPGVYDHYYVADFCELAPEQETDLGSWEFTCLVSVAALGFGDIPPEAFVQALDLVGDDAWVAFNIKKNFLDHSDESGFSALVRELIFSEYMDLYHLERYRHRLSIEGESLYYLAIVARKTGAPLPAAVRS